MGGLPTFSLFPDVVGGAGELCGLSYLFLAVLGLRRCMGFLSSCGAWAAYCSGFSCRGAWVVGRVGLVVVCELQVVIPMLESTGSIVVACGVICSAACGVFPDQGSNPFLLQWQVDSLPLSHQGSPVGSLIRALNPVQGGLAS